MLYARFGPLGQPVVDETYHVPTTQLRSVRPKGTLNSAPDGCLWDVEMKVRPMKKACGDLWNQG